MLSHDEQRIIEDIQQHLDRDDPVFAGQMRRPLQFAGVRPAMPATLSPLLAVIAVISGAAWVEVGLGWLAGLICATIPTAAIGRQAWRRHRRR